MKPKRSLTKIFALMLSGVSLVSIFLIGALWISFENNRSNRESQQIRRDYVANLETSVSLETNRICDYIEAQRHAEDLKLLKTVKGRVYEANDFISSINDSLPASVDRRMVKEIILAGLKGVSSTRGRGHFFISTGSGHELLYTYDLSHTFNEETAAADTSGYSSPSDFMEIADSLKNIKEGFFRYNLHQRSDNISNQSVDQMAYLKVYEPFDWIIGSSEYLDDWSGDIQSEIIAWAGNMPLPANINLTIINYSGDILYHPELDKRGKNVFLDINDPKLQQTMASIIRGAKDHDKDFIRYNLDNAAPGAENIAFYRNIHHWKWVVVTWVDLRDLEAVMRERQSTLIENVRAQITRIVVISISMLLLILMLSKVISTLATKSFSAFFAFFERASTSSIEINPDDQPFEEFSRLAVAANNMINQRKLANNLLRESELKFKTVFDVSPQIITISNINGILMDANEEFKKFSRLSQAAATGRPLEDSLVISPQIRQEIWQELKRHNSVIGREVEAVNLDGSPLTFLVFGRMIHMHSNAFILAIFTDITALKVAEKEKLVLQEKLSRSTKMEAMGLMAAEVAHDLNNILSGIIGYPQLLLMEQNITDKQKEALKEILETGQRAAAVVSDLLTIARGVATIKVSLPVNQVVTDYTNSPECKQLMEIFPSVELKLELDPEAGNIIASSVHLTKVVMNLVSNAFEAMPPDKADGRVMVETVNMELADKLPGYDGVVEPGRYCLIRVSDNGPGIPAEDVNKIFEPFYSKKTKGRSGTGLGLAIVWNTIQDHNGYLTVSTSPQGTIFSLYFKLTEEKTASRDKRKNLDEFKGSGQRVLVVDDVDIQRKLACKMLSTLGYSPMAVPSGEAAIELLKKENVDLVILDMIMHPGMNGRETYGAIMEFKPGQKAIIASGMAETEEVAKAQAMGAGQFVNKPYTIEDLASAVQKALALP